MYRIEISERAVEKNRYKKLNEKKTFRKEASIKPGRILLNN